MAEDEIGKAVPKSWNSDDTSILLADRLLKGWTLLNEYCPQCLTVLVRNLDRKMYCVVCAQWVIPEAQAAGRDLLHRDGGFGKGGRNIAPDVVGRSDTATQTPSTSGHTDQRAGDIANALMENEVRNRIVEDKSHMKTSAIVLPKVDAHLRTKEVLSNTLSALVQKIEEIRCVLVISQNIDDIKQLLSVLGECLEAVGHLKALGMSVDV